MSWVLYLENVDESQRFKIQVSEDGPVLECEPLNDVGLVMVDLKTTDEGEALCLQSIVLLAAAERRVRNCQPLLAFVSLADDNVVV